MPKFAANLTMLFNEVDFLDRFKAASIAGFEAVEYLFPYAYKAEDLAARLADNGLKQVLFNMPPGDWEAGERGIAALPKRKSEFQESVDVALEYARALKCPTVHMMAGIVPEGASREKYWETYVENLGYTADRMKEDGIKVVVEPLNSRDVPNYLMSRQGQGAQAVREAGRGNLGLQFDFYHCQIMEGDLAMHVREFADVIGHIQIAGVPERHEPDVGEINYAYLFDLLDEIGYDGWVGCEYRPAGDTVAGLGWLRAAQR